MDRKTQGFQFWDVNPKLGVRDLLRWSMNVRGADRLILSAHLDRDDPRHPLMKPEIDSLVERVFENSILRTGLATAWPGTQLVGHADKVYVMMLSDSVADRMAEIENRLSAWTQWHQPRLPENLCTFRTGDPYPCLVSVTHSEEAWILHDENLGPEIGVLSDGFPIDLIPPPPEFVAFVKD